MTEPLKSNTEKEQDKSIMTEATTDPSDKSHVPTSSDTAPLERGATIPESNLSQAKTAASTQITTAPSVRSSSTLGKAPSSKLETKPLNAPSERSKAETRSKPIPETETVNDITSEIQVKTEKFNLDSEDNTKDSPPPYEPQEVYIAVMGQTGTGKSTFISEVTGQEVVIGHDLESCTQTVDVFETIIGGRVVKLIDTPGFDDTSRSDTEILEEISSCLSDLRPDMRLTGIIYLRKITDNRMPGSAIRNLRLLEKMCGEEYYGNIVLATTFWSIVKTQEGERREAQLRSTDLYWGELIKRGAIVLRHDRKNASALEILNHVLQRTPMVLQFQRELAMSGIIAKTSAGQEVILYLAKEKEHTLKEIKKLKEELQKVVNEKKTIQAEREAMEAEMEAQMEALEKKRTTVEEEMRRDINTLQQTVRDLEVFKSSLQQKVDTRQRDSCCIQ